MTAADQTTQMFEALFGTTEESFINLRAIPPKGSGRTPIEEFIPAKDIARVISRANELKATHDVYFGVAARTRPSGGADSVAEVWAIWADFDSPEASAMLDGFELEPSLRVASGRPGHCHGYWFLKEPIEGEQAEVLNHRLALRLDADVACRDRARILRVPGTLNRKGDPPYDVTISSFTGTRYEVSDLDRVLPDLPAAETSKSAKEAAKAPSPVVRNVLDKLENVREEGNGWKAVCPAHNDHDPSLSVAEGDDGKCLIHCFAGCATEDIVEAIGLTMADLYGGSKNVRLAQRVITLAVDQGAELFRTPAGDGWIGVSRNGVRDFWKVKSGATEEWLHELYYRTTSGVIGREAMNEVLGILNAKAKFEGSEHEVHIRVAGNPTESIYVDLGDSDRTVIQIDSHGFAAVTEGMARFYRQPSATALPVPDPGGNVEVLREFVNVRSEDGWKRLIGFLIMCFHPTGPYPILNLYGEQGSAKSTVTRMLLDLVDPHKAGLLGGAVKAEDLAITATSTHLIALDNVSQITRSFSDLLCRLSTGGGVRKRRLHTDTEEVVLEYRRPLILNGINQVMKAPDLLERSAPVELRVISPEHRRTETDIWADWQQARPLILGGLLNAVSAAITNIGSTKIADLPRLADWALWVEAAADYLGWDQGEFKAAIDSGQEEQVELSIDDHIEVRGLIELMSDKDELRLTATDLLAEIHKHLDIDPKGRRDVLKRGADLSRVLRQFAPALRKHGIECEHGRTGGGTRDRYILVTRIEGTTGR